MLHSQKLDWGHQNQRPRAGKTAQLEVVCHRFPLCWCNNDVPTLQRVAGRTGQGVSDNQVAVGMVPGCSRRLLFAATDLVRYTNIETMHEHGHESGARTTDLTKKFESVRWDLGTTANFETQGPLYVFNVGHTMYMILNVSGIKYT